MSKSGALQSENLAVLAFRDWGSKGGDVRNTSLIENVWLLARSDQVRPARRDDLRLLPMATCSEDLVHQSFSFSDPLRLLPISPGKEGGPINCTLQISRLHHSTPPYDALSYAWGSGKSKRQIVCNGKSLTVNDNLWDALDRLRDLDTRCTTLLG